MLRKALTVILVIVLLVFVVIIFSIKKNRDHQKYLASFSEVDKLDDGIRYILDYYDVKGASISIIHNYRIIWTKGYGVTDSETSSPILNNTLFDVGSISKSISAIAVMNSLKNYGVSIDTDVSKLLDSWKLHENEFTVSKKVTIRQLLSHQGGINVHGFLGYTDDESLPTLHQVLEGQFPANSDNIEVVQTPGESFMYSGGGYCILQQMIQDITNRSFEDVVRKEVFEKVGMKHSTFRQDSLEYYFQSLARGHIRGDTFKVKRMRFAELAAAGLKTTSEDLAMLLLSIRLSLNGQSSALLDKTQSELMVSQQANEYGLGFELADNGKNRFFGHGGANIGFKSLMIASTEEGYGIVVLTNSSKDGNIIWFENDKSRNEIVDLISRVYKWGMVPKF